MTRTRIFAALIFALLLAPAALADAPAAADDAQPAVTQQATPAEGEVVEQESPQEEPSGDLATEIDPALDFEAKYLCPPGSCTYDWDCQMNEEPSWCEPDLRTCTGTTGTPCSGYCVCC